MMEQTKLWTKNFIILSSINFFLTLMFFLLNSIIALYAVDKFHVSTGIGGLVSGIFIIGALIGRLFSKKVMDSIGAKRVLIMGTFLFTAITLLYFIESHIVFLILSRFLHGIALGLGSTVIGTMIALIIPPARKGEGISYFSISTALATGIGPFVGVFMTQRTSFQMIFMFCFVLGVMSLALSLLSDISEEKQLKVSSNAKGVKIDEFIAPKAIPISVIMLVSAFCFSSILAYLNLYAIEVNLVDTASVFFIVYAITVLISRPLTGRVVDTKGENYVMYPAIISFGIGMFILSSAQTSLALLIAAVFVAFGFGNIQSCIQVIAVNSVASQQIGLATATFLIFFECGSGLGPSILGLFVSSLGYQKMYAILGGIVLLSIVLYYVLHGHKKSLCVFKK